MSCTSCLARSAMTITLERVATPEDRPAVGADQLARIRQDCVDYGILTLCRCDPRYPAGIAQLSDPPPVIYVRGNASVLGLDYERGVGIVGTRRPTTAGRDASRRFAAGFAQAGGTVVSGMALGIDAAAHDGALSVRGTTIAVLAGGVERPTPASNGHLYSRILERGAVVSELPPRVTPRKWTFPARNRLIAALSGCTVVVEAPARSGALITVDHANDLGRDVYAIPGSTAAPTCEGSNRLLMDSANPVLDGAELAAERGMTVTVGAGPLPATEPGRRVHEELARGPRSTAELAGAVSTLGPGELELLLLDLELAGWVARRSDGRYGRSEPWAA